MKLSFDWPRARLKLSTERGDRSRTPPDIQIKLSVFGSVSKNTDNVKARCYVFFFMLSSAEHEILNAHKYKISRK